MRPRQPRRVQKVQNDRPYISITREQVPFSYCMNAIKHCTTTRDYQGHHLLKNLKKLECLIFFSKEMVCIKFCPFSEMTIVERILPLPTIRTVKKWYMLLLHSKYVPFFQYSQNLLFGSVEISRLWLVV